MPFWSRQSHSSSVLFVQTHGCDIERWMSLLKHDPSWTGYLRTSSLSTRGFLSCTKPRFIMFGISSSPQRWMEVANTTSFFYSSSASLALTCKGRWIDFEIMILHPGSPSVSDGNESGGMLLQNLGGKRRNGWGKVSLSIPWDPGHNVYEDSCATCQLSGSLASRWKSALPSQWTTCASSIVRVAPFTARREEESSREIFVDITGSSDGTWRLIWKPKSKVFRVLIRLK